MTTELATRQDRVGGKVYEFDYGATSIAQYERRQQVAEMWLVGTSYNKMAEVLIDPVTRQRPSHATIANDIREICSFLHDVNSQELDGWRASAYARLEHELGELHEQRDLLDETMVDQYAKLTNSILRILELQAKVQGVLSEKHLHVEDKSQTYVMYQFNDKLPPPPGQALPPPGKVAIPADSVTLPPSPD